MIPLHLPAASDRAPSMNAAWVRLLRHLLAYGRPVNPAVGLDDVSLLNRVRETVEILHNPFAIDMNRPVLTLPRRGMNYSLMAAEALWILAGDDRVATIEPWTSKLRQYSDDGVTFFGAYGPPIARQLPYCVRTLLKDGNTRQAVINVWRESPGPTKNPPCTIALSFSLRDEKLHAHLYLRSSDTWLGLPYDLFGMTLVAARVAAALAAGGGAPVELGNLYVIAASSHFYEEHRPLIERVLQDEVPESPLLDWSPAVAGEWEAVEEDLMHTRDKLAGRPTWLDIRPQWSYEKLEELS